MKTASTAFVVASLLVLLLATPAGAEDLRQAVEAGNRSLIASILRGDATAVADHYTKDAQIIAQGAPIASGRDAIIEFWRGSIASGIEDVTLETAEVEADGDLAYETGTLGIVSDEGTRTSARYVVVYKREGDKWLLHRDTWNSE